VIAKVSATRMELLRMKKRLSLARRGHYLLKGKQDELLRRFMALLEEYLPRRRDLERAFAGLENMIGEAAAETGAAEAAAAGWPLPPPVTVERGKDRILNLEVPVRRARNERHLPSYGPLQLPLPFDDVIAGWADMIPVLLDGADREETLLLLADEIERTRRRVNALEFRLVPDLEEGIRRITFKLAEAELGNLSRLMRVKEIVRSR
jgi:V/A-type H+-transporting ATPase subunit D